MLTELSIICSKFARLEYFLMKHFPLFDKIAAVFTFALAMITYGLTVEPTASFWDCPEFITTAYRLEVGHPPGAPFFMLTGKFFSLFASDPTQVAFMINMMSAFLSALTIMLLYLTISHLAKRIIAPETGEMTRGQMTAIIGSGIIGAAVYTFSDTFWFSAVEGEVYAYSSLLTALVFYLILRWEIHADEERSDRYLILITYLMGLSIGVHLLNLLTIPALVLVYYFRKHSEYTWKGVCGALLVSCVILAAILYGIVPGCITLASYVELFFVNTLGLPFNSGALFYFALMVAVIIWAIIELYRKNYSVTRIKISSLAAATLIGVPFLGGSWLIGILVIAAVAAYFIMVKDKLNIRMMSTIMLAMASILVGYSCYALIVIRSAANPPMDQNSPDNVFALKTYLNREQYGDRPLFYGPYYSAEPELVIEGDYCRAKTVEEEGNYVKREKRSADEKDEYIETPPRIRLVYGKEFQTIFPRMHSMAGGHAQAYESWVDIEGKKVDYDRCGEQIKVTVPTFGENLEFFFRYQLNYMYWRYFMWNFSGRQNDVQGHGEITNGNWITGFDFIDRFLVGPQDDLPPYYKDNKGHNAYFMLPFLLGILGLAYQLSAGKKGREVFGVTLTLFFMTGIAIVLYLNQGPMEPRERDYAYAGSFYAYSIWVGFGVAGLCKLLRGCKLRPDMAAVLAFVLAIPAPVIMASENWDDHDRSGRYPVRDFGLNYFNSCADNAVIFTNGDNDTFPLWYLQETEGSDVALDKRVCNLSYLQTDWYIEQMIRPAHESAPLPITWDRQAYIEGKRDVVYLYDFMPEDTLDLKYMLDEFLASDDPATKTDPRTGDYKEFLPCKRFSVPVNVDNLIKQGAITEDQRDMVADKMIIDLSNRNYLTKSDIMVLEMIANSNWERPLYYAVTVGSDMYMGMSKYFQLEGLAYRIVPFKDGTDGGRVATDLMYDNMMHKFRFGNMSDESIYVDENLGRMCMAHRQMFDRLIDALIMENKADSALKALDYCMEVLPDSTIPMDFSSVSFVDYYYILGQNEKAKALGRTIGDRAAENLAWLSRLNERQQASAMTEIGLNLAAIQHLALITQETDPAEFEYYFDIFQQYGYLYQ